MAARSLQRVKLRREGIVDSMIRPVSRLEQLHRLLPTCRLFWEFV